MVRKIKPIGEISDYPSSYTKQIKNLLTPPSANERKKTITLFMVIVFSLLMVMSAYIPNWFIQVWFQVILFIAQLVILKALLDDYYG